MSGRCVPLPSDSILATLSGSGALLPHLMCLLRFLFLAVKSVPSSNGLLSTQPSAFPSSELDTPLLLQHRNNSTVVPLRAGVLIASLTFGFLRHPHRASSVASPTLFTPLTGNRSPWQQRCSTAAYAQSSPLSATYLTSSHTSAQRGICPISISFKCEVTKKSVLVISFQPTTNGISSMI